MLDYDKASIDEVLRDLINGSGLIEVTCCLDMIATEKGSRVAMFNWEGRQYPANGGDLKIPDPDWLLTKGENNEETINTDYDTTNSDTLDAERGQDG